MLEEGWGELPTTQGAVNQPTPLLQTLQVMEQEMSRVEQLTTPREQDRPAAPAPVREQSLVQMDITSFLDQAASYQDCPTQQPLLVDNEAEIPSATTT